MKTALHKSPGPQTHFKPKGVTTQTCGPVILGKRALNSKWVMLKLRYYPQPLWRQAILGPWVDLIKTVHSLKLASSACLCVCYIISVHAACIWKQNVTCREYLLSTNNGIFLRITMGGGGLITTLSAFGSVSKYRAKNVVFPSNTSEKRWHLNPEHWLSIRKPRVQFPSPTHNKTKIREQINIKNQNINMGQVFSWAQTLPTYPKDLKSYNSIEASILPRPEKGQWRESSFKFFTWSLQTAWVDSLNRAQKRHWAEICAVVSVWSQFYVLRWPDCSHRYNSSEYLIILWYICIKYICICHLEDHKGHRAPGSPTSSRSWILGFYNISVVILIANDLLHKKHWTIK